MMPRTVEPVRIDKMGVCQSQCRRFLVHARYEAFRIPRGSGGEGQGGVIAGGQQQSLQQLADGIALPRAQIHG